MLTFMDMLGVGLWRPEVLAPPASGFQCRDEPPHVAFWN